MAAEKSPAEVPSADSCARCPIRAVGVCCSSHGKKLCHRCYRLTHFVERCAAACQQCAAEGLPLVLTGKAVSDAR